jgi:hypothetical protein
MKRYIVDTNYLYTRIVLKPAITDVIRDNARCYSAKTTSWMTEETWASKVWNFSFLQNARATSEASQPEIQ